MPARAGTRFILCGATRAAMAFPVPNTSSGVNENVIVADSGDNGDNWSSGAQLNNSIPGRRYSPWVCSTGGTAYVSWYDRRNASASTNDATDYFAGSAAPAGAFGFL